MDAEQKKLKPHDEPGWKGYTLDELRYQKAVAMIRLEMEKEKISAGFSQMKNGMPMMSTGGIAGKIMGSLNYLDYALIAYKSVTKITSMVRKMKRR